jgi:hypothetical protein
LSSCDFDPNDKVVPKWEMEILGPLLKGDLSIEDIAELDSLHASKSFSLSDFGAPAAGTIIIPAIPSMNLGPYALDMTDAFASAELESGELYFKITNQLEINVNSGTTIILKNGASTILSNTIPSDIAALNGSYTSPVTNLSNVIIGSNLTLQINNFSSDGSGGLVTINPSRKLILDVYLRNVKVKTITISTAESFSIVDTSDFAISGNNIKSESASGTLTTYVTNHLPVDFKFQVYFMDETKTIKKDSLFASAVNIPAASGATPSQSTFAVNLDQATIDALNNSDFARTYLKLNTASNVTIPNTVEINFQMVGDLKLKLSDQ